MTPPPCSLPQAFFAHPAEVVAPELIGCLLPFLGVAVVDGSELASLDCEFRGKSGGINCAPFPANPCEQRDEHHAERDCECQKISS